MLRFSRFFALCCALLLATSPCSAQEAGGEIEDNDFNYVYSTVLGTGFYSTSTERVFILRVPLKWTVAEFNEKSSLDLLVPVSVGVREPLDENGSLEIPDRLMTASLLPGVAWDYKAKENWQISPSLQAGIAQDFQDDTTAWLYSIGVRSYAWWDIGKNRLGLGNRIVGAGQHIESSNDQQGFVMIENGLDWNYQLPWSLADQALSTSIFVLWQHFNFQSFFLGNFKELLFFWIFGSYVIASEFFNCIQRGRYQFWVCSKTISVANQPAFFLLFQ